MRLSAHETLFRMTGVCATFKGDEESQMQVSPEPW
jgi:hypothetical protein